MVISYDVNLSCPSLRFWGRSLNSAYPHDADGLRNWVVLGYFLFPASIFLQDTIQDLTRDEMPNAVGNLIGLLCTLVWLDRLWLSSSVHQSLANYSAQLDRAMLTTPRRRTL